MKNNHLIKLTGIILITFIVSSFTIKDEQPLSVETKSKNISEYTDEILVSYPPGANKSAVRNCIANSFNGLISQITQCSSNPNIEILRFSNILFQKTNGVHDNTDPDRRPSQSITLISQQQILDAMASCNAFIFAFNGTHDCAAFGAFGSGF